MFEEGDIEQEYASYEALKDSSCIGMTCFSNSNIDSYRNSIIGQKMESHYTPIQYQDIHQTQEEEDQVYFRLKETFEECLREERKVPLEYSIFKVYRSTSAAIQKESGSASSLVSSAPSATTSPPFPLLHLSQHCRGKSANPKEPGSGHRYCGVKTVSCLLLLLRRHLTKQSRSEDVSPHCQPHPQKDHSLLSLTNKDISVTNLSNMMHSDCSVMLMYPAKLFYLIENVVSFILLSGIVIYVSGLPGLIGIACVGVNLIFRYAFKSLQGVLIKNSTSVPKKGHPLLSKKANALQSCYFNKLSELRLNQVRQLKTKLPILFTVNLCIIIINMQAILNAHAYIDIIQMSIRNIEDFLKQKEMNFSPIKYSNNTSGKYAIEIEEGNFQWGRQRSQRTKEEEVHLRNINLKIKKGELVTLIGSTAAERPPSSAASWER